MQEKRKAYYLVWNPQTGYIKHKHKYSSSAKTEAERLARQHQGQEFVVLKAVASCKVDNLHWAEMSDNADDFIPF